MLYVNGSQPKSVIVGGWDYRAVKVVKNGIETGVWGKPFTLTYSVNTSGATISVKRISSPNQHASTGVTLTNGSTIYYGDELEFTAVLQDGYIAVGWEFNDSVVWGENIGTITQTCDSDLNVVLNIEGLSTGSWHTVYTGTLTYRRNMATYLTVKNTANGVVANLPTRVTGYGYNSKTAFTEIEIIGRTKVVTDEYDQYIEAPTTNNSLSAYIKGKFMNYRGIVITKIEQFY